jgi:hypothetical protein
MTNPRRIVESAVERDIRQALAPTRAGLRRALTEGRERVLTQYSDGGNVLAASRKTRPTLEAGCYKIVRTMEGIMFERVETNSDHLLRFEDSRYNEILTEVDQFWDLAEKFEAVGLTHKRGVLLWGQPGQGKSCLLHQVTEDAIKKDCVVFLGGRDMGTTVAGLKQFKEVEQARKALVVMEDMDEICRYDEHSVLEMMDGGDQMNGVLVVGTTNYVDRLPPRVLRSGRFDTKMEVLAPPLAGRAAYFKHKLEKFESPERIQEIAETTDGLSFAQMREYVASVYVFGKTHEESVKRIRMNFTESAAGAKGETLLLNQLAAKGLIAEAKKPAFINGWKADVRKAYPEAVFGRDHGNMTLTAKVGKRLVGRYSESTGVGEIRKQK